LNGADDGRQSREHVWFGLLFQFIKLHNYADYIMKQWKEASGISGTYDDRNVNSRAKMGIMSSIWHGFFSISLKKCLSSLATLPSTTTVVITLHTKTKTKGVYQSLWLLGVLPQYHQHPTLITKRKTTSKGRKLSFMHRTQNSGSRMSRIAYYDTNRTWDMGIRAKNSY
jgi:hypothetical protein